MALIKNILNESYDETQTSQPNGAAGGEQSAGGNNYEFVNSLLSGSMDSSPDVTDPSMIYSGYNEDVYNNSAKAFGGLRSENYLNLLYPNMNQQLLKGNYQGSIVGSVPIFTAKDNISPLAMMAYRRDQLRAASYAALQDQLKPAKWEIPTTKIPMYSDKIRESFVSGMKYWDEVATQITRKTGQDGWKVLESGKTEYGIMYRNFLSSMNGLANKFDYIALYAAKQQDLREKGFYVGIDTDKTLGEVFQGAENVENFVYNDDIGSLIDRLGAQMNFNSVLYDAIKTMESDVKQTYSSDPTFSDANMKAWVVKYLESDDATGRNRLDAIADNLIAQYPTLADGQDITKDKIKSWISAYTGVKDIQTLNVQNIPKTQTIMQVTPDNTDAMAAGAFADINDLGKGNTFIGDKGTMKRVGGLIEANIDGTPVLVNPANTDAVLRYMLLAKGYTAEKIDQMSVNLKSQFQAEYANAFNNLTGTPQETQDKITAVQNAYKSNINNPTQMVNSLVAENGYGLPVPNTPSLYITGMKDLESPDKDEYGVTRQYTVQIGDLQNVKGVILPISSQTLGNYANNVRTTSEGIQNTISIGEGSLTFYKTGDYIVIPDAVYSQATEKGKGLTTSKVLINGEPLQIDNKDIFVSNQTYKNLAYSSANNVVQSYKKIDKVETGNIKPVANVVSVGDRAYTGQWYRDKKAEAIAAYQLAESLKTSDAFKGFDWANMTPQKRIEIINLIMSNPDNQDLVVKQSTTLNQEQIESQYKKLFGQ